MKRIEQVSDRSEQIRTILMERAVARHKRRIRNQIIAYLTVVVVLAVTVFFAWQGTIRLVDVIADRQAAAKLAKEAEAAEAARNAELADEEALEELEAVVSNPETETQDVQEEAVAEEGPSDQELLDEYIDSMISEMPLTDRVAGLLFVTPEGLTGVDAAIKAGDGTKTALAEMAVGGIVYSQINFKSEEQIKEMLTATSEMSKYPLFMATDEPGGDEGELTTALQLERISAPAELAESGDTAAAYSAGESLAKRLVDYGFSVNLAPAVNLTSDSMSENNRKLSFGSDPVYASTVLAEEVRGMEENGVHTVAYLFPTIEDASDESNIPTTAVTTADLEDGDYRMFAAAIEAGTRIVMVGNLAAPQITGDNTPCSMSSKIITDELRNAISYDGLVMTAALDDPVITDYYTADQAAVSALKAGADMIYRPENVKEAMDGILDAVNSGVISEERINESLRRVYRLKYANWIGKNLG